MFSFPACEKIHSVIELYPKGIAGFRRFTEFVDTIPDIRDRPTAISVSHLRGNMHYNKVSFGFREDHSVLDNINLSIRAGETIAFVRTIWGGQNNTLLFATKVL